jgi:hypothetical protein
MDNAKQVTKALMLTALIVTTAFSGALVANFIIGNLLEKDVTVPTDAVTISFTEADLDLLGISTVDYGAIPDSPCRGVTYDTGLTMQASSNVDGVVIQFEIAALDISTDSVTVMYYDATDLSWHQLAFTDMGNVLTATFGPVEGFTATIGEDLTSYFLMTYNVPGSYMMDLWPERMA